jgi:hypothetical protein
MLKSTKLYQGTLIEVVRQGFDRKSLIFARYRGLKPRGVGARADEIYPRHNLNLKKSLILPISRVGGGPHLYMFTQMIIYFSLVNTWERSKV